MLGCSALVVLVKGWFYTPASSLCQTSAICALALRTRERGVSVLTLTMVARCLRCYKMYEEEGGGGCYYHPGTHRGDSHYGRTGLMCGWSCCKVLPPTRIP